MTDDSAAQKVRAAGAVPRPVARSGAVLKRAADTLYRSARIPGTEWAVDPASDQVVVSADDSVKGAGLARLRSVSKKLGATVRIEHVNGKVRPFDGPTMLDGTGIYSAGATCSLGFNVFKPNGNPADHYFITAGHCTHLGADWFAGPNWIVGPFVGFNANDNPGIYSPAGDYGFVRYAASGLHVFGEVAGDSSVFIASSGTPFVGQPVKRSGITTGVRGGTVTALKVTVNFSNGVTVNNLIKTNACAEPGDSGGPLYSGSVGLGLFPADPAIAPAGASRTSSPSLRF